MAKGRPEEEKRQKIGQQEGARSSLAGRPCLYIIYFNDCDYPERSPQPKLNWAEPSFLFFFCSPKSSAQKRARKSFENCFARWKRAGGRFSVGHANLNFDG